MCRYILFIIITSSSTHQRPAAEYYCRFVDTTLLLFSLRSETFMEDKT